MYMTDSVNLRIQWWYRNASNGNTVVRNVGIHGVALDSRGALYITESEKGELSKSRVGETVGQVIASGLNGPLNLYIDRDRSIYFVERSRSRAVKIVSMTGEIIRVGGGSHGNQTDQWASPNSIIVDRSGTVIAGGHGRGTESNQILSSTDLAFDLEGNLYVADDVNHRVQKFAIDRSVC